MIPDCLRRSLIVSCQAPPGDPLDDVDALRRIAASAVKGGARGLRANGVECVKAFRRDTGVPVIGIQKRRIANEVSITPDFASAKSIAEAGADIIALDCSSNRSATAEPWQDVLRRIHAEIGKPVLADIATFEESIAVQDAGVDAVATTLYGFTRETSGYRAVNWELVARLIKVLRVPLIVEGHISRPEEAAKAIELGAYAVVVGAAITRPESIAARFAAALQG
jgi:N-acylglucosamine-6-phosphate 2-epimerase